MHHRERTTQAVNRCRRHARSCRVWLIASLGLSAIAVAGCSRMWTVVEIDYLDRSKALRTFDWAIEDPPTTGDERLRDPELRKLVLAALTKEFAERNISQTSNGPDFLVNFHLAVTERLTASSARPKYRYNPSYAPETYMRTFEEGSLILDIINPNNKRLLWRGVVQTEIEAKPEPEVRAQRIRTAVRTLMRRFPRPSTAP